MKLFVGLGNPGEAYEKTRHNSGFFVLDMLSEKRKLNFKKSIRFNAEIAKDKDYILCKPLTFMNKSGEAVKKVVVYYHIDLKDIVVVFDDLDLPIGKIRLRPFGSSGGQKGMQNIIDLLNTSDIKRIRIGIGNDKQIENYVLTKIKADEWEAYAKACDKAAEALQTYLNMPFEKVMNQYNG